MAGYPGPGGYAYGAPPGTYGAPPGSYGAPPGPYGAPPSPYGAPPGPYGAPPGPYGAPPVGFVYPGGYAQPGYAPQPGAERPPKEHSFYIKSSSHNVVMEVVNGSVDPGARIVLATHTGQGHDSQLWFEDYQTGTIKSRLNLLCIDIQEGGSQPYHLLKSPSSVPPQAVCVGTVSGQPQYSAVAHTQWGSIPGRSVVNQCWYPYGGAEYCTADFSWVVAQSPRLVRNTGSPPAGAIGVGHQTDDGCTYFLGVAHSPHGNIPGKAKGNVCWFSHGGREQYVNDFDWVVAESNHAIVNHYVPGKSTQLWLRSGDLIQNRNDPSKVLQSSNITAGSSVFSSVSNQDQKQRWTFFSPGTSAPPFVAPPAIPVQPMKKPRRYFYIRSEMHGKVLDVTGANKQAGTKAILWPRKGVQEDNQLWYLDDQNIIRSKLNDFCLQPSGGHGLWMQAYTGQPNQMWTPQGNRIVLKDNPKFCMDIKGENRNDGALVCQFQYKGSANQHWQLDYIN